MKVLTQYICEVCGEKHGSQSSAEECEAKGVLNPDLFPVGLMKTHTHHGYVGAFAVAEVSNHGWNKHLCSFLFWACRAPNYPGDSLGDERCGSGSLFNNERAIEFFIYCSPEKDLHRPEFIRLIKWLRAQNIKPCYYNEAKELIYI